MTGTDRIKERILQDAEAAAQSIRENGRREASDIMETARTQCETQRTDAERRIEQGTTAQLQRGDANLHLELRKRELTVRQQLVKEAFATAASALQELPDSDWQDLMAGMILSADWDGDAELVVSGSDRERLGVSFAGRIEEARRASGKSGRIVFAEDELPEGGGFILRSGEMEINGTLSVVLAGIRPKVEQNVVQTLFG